jgi:hypothetical protein
MRLDRDPPGLGQRPQRSGIIEMGPWASTMAADGIMAIWTGMAQALLRRKTCALTG